MYDPTTSWCFNFEKILEKDLTTLLNPSTLLLTSKFPTYHQPSIRDLMNKSLIPNQSCSANAKLQSIQPMDGSNLITTFFSTFDFNKVMVDNNYNLWLLPWSPSGFHGFVLLGFLLFLSLLAQHHIHVIFFLYNSLQNVFAFPMIHLSLYILQSN